jgi:hypothetical protein
MSAPKANVEMVPCPLQYMYIEGLCCCEPDQFRQLPPTINSESGRSLLTLWKRIHTHPVLYSCGLHTFNDHCQIYRNIFLRISFCPDNKACHYVTNGLMLPQIWSNRCNQLLTSFIWILPLAKIIDQHANSIIWTLNRIPSWIPAAQNRFHSCPLRQCIMPDTPIGRVVLMKEHLSFR